ncbi:MAG: hypothetical protein ACI9B9_001115 [Halioglobus sp.]|jgi:uncharacterized protein (DUF2062 family)
MPKQTLKHFSPSPERLKKIKSLRVLGDWVYEPNLWHITRYSASMSFFVGLFVAFIPLPGQMVIAAVLSVWLRCNLPLAIGLAWITNPLTIPAIFYLSYRVGALILDVPTHSIDFELSFNWLASELVQIWRPFLLGCLTCGFFFGALGYFVISMLWRMRVARLWRQRKARRRKQALAQQAPSPDAKP